MFIQVVYQQFTFLFQRKERVTSAYMSLNFHEQERIFFIILYRDCCRSYEGIKRQSQENILLVYVLFSFFHYISLNGRKTYLRKRAQAKTLLKHAHSNILKVLPQKKNENFQIKILIFFIFLLKSTDCGYSLEPPRQGGSNEYHNLCF